METVLREPWPRGVLVDLACRVAALTAPLRGACSIAPRRTMATDRWYLGHLRGAMNAVVLVDGYEKGGPEGARAALERFLRRVSHSAGSARSGPGPWICPGPVDIGQLPFFVAFDSQRVCSRRH